VHGDARLSLEAASPQNFDFFAVDAFSSDAIPVHLLTREAFELYLRHLHPSGTLAIHISNRYLELEPVVLAAARAIGLHTATIVNTLDEPNMIYTAKWVLLARESEDLPVQPIVPAWTATPLKELAPWTDNYSNLLQVLK
jgi:hypothetical protein